MSLLVLAYPDLAPAERAWIEAIRADHDSLHALVPAHFTFVFPTDLLAPEAFIAAVQMQAAGFGPFAFALRAALPAPNLPGTDGQVFLVPDEGMSACIRLHDRLYAGLLAPALRLDLPFVPHITVGRFPDLPSCKRRADALNARPFAVPGAVNTLDVVKRTPDAIRTLVRVPLG